MATLANLFGRFMTARALEAAPGMHAREQEDPFLLRAIPNEDVYFYVKRIDNARVVREAEPGARGAAWKVIGSSFAVAVLLVGPMLPSVYGLLAGYRLESLRQEKHRLEIVRAGLELEETRLLSPARLEELAKKQQFIDPAPQKLVYLEGKPEGTLAKR